MPQARIEQGLLHYFGKIQLVSVAYSAWEPWENFNKLFGAASCWWLKACKLYWGWWNYCSQFFVGSVRCSFFCAAFPQQGNTCFPFTLWSAWAPAAFCFTTTAAFCERLQLTGLRSGHGILCPWDFQDSTVELLGYFPVKLITLSSFSQTFELRAYSEKWHEPLASANRFLCTAIIANVMPKNHAAPSRIWAHQFGFLGLASSDEYRLIHYDFCRRNCSTASG